MRTDWILIARLAAEIDRRFAGARVRDAGELDDGRFGIELWRGETELLCADLFASTPVLTVERGELAIKTESHFARIAGRALRGKTLLDAAAPHRERLIRITFGARSRFGVANEYTVIYELVPRFGNIILVKDELVVAALKEFAASKNAQRTIRAGKPYAAPPPRAPRALIPSELSEVEIKESPLLVCRDERGAILQAHLRPLPEFESLPHEERASLLDVFGEWRRESQQPADNAVEKRRSALAGMLESRRVKVQDELERIESRLRQTSDRDRLRAEGEAIFTRLHELPAAERKSAKARAAKLFEEYKRLGTAHGHAERRLAQARQTLDDLEQLRWELERADDSSLDDVATALQAVVPRRRPKAAVAKQPRKPPQYALASGSRITVGRSPLENAHVTFRIARPGDLWFHTRGQPGAHVILQRDDRQTPSEEEIRAAASLAALHSKARNSTKVAVDYTERKYVRKRPAAAPGLVFYTNARSIVVSPGEPPGPVAKSHAG